VAGMTSDERAVLGALIGGSHEWATTVRDWIAEAGVTRRDLTPPAASLLDLVDEMLVGGRPITLTSVPEYAVEAGRVAAVGGLDELIALPERQATANAMGVFLRSIKREAHRRRVGHLLRVATTEVAAPHAEPGDVAAAVADALLQDEREAGDWVSLQEAISRALDDVLDAIEQPAQHQLLQTGLTELDAIIGGMGAGDLVVIAGRPGMGKSALALDIARYNARCGHTVAMFSLEMLAPQLGGRALASRARVDSRKLRRTSELTRDELHALQYHAGDCDDLSRIWIDDTAQLTVAQMRGRLRALLRRTGELRLVVVDYLGLVRAEQADNREQAVASISGGLKALAKELRCPIVVLCQLNRQCEQRTDKRPLLSDLRESGAIEQDADTVLFPFRAWYYNPAAPEGEAEVAVAKSRHGATGTAEVGFHGPTVSFRNR